MAGSAGRAREGAGGGDGGGVGGSAWAGAGGGGGRAGESSGGGAGGVGPSWAEVAKGGAGEVGWSSFSLPVAEEEALQSFFSAALILPPADIQEERGKWLGKALLVRSLGRRVPPSWIGRDIRLRLGLEADPELTPIAEEHVIVRFPSSDDCDRAVGAAPWVVAGQLLAFERWRPGFNPSRTPVTKAVVWLRLPALPVECWTPSSILAIAGLAGKPISLDSFTIKLRKKGFARVRIELDSACPLRPGVVVEAGDLRFWQRFLFENLPAVCFACGLVGHVEELCPLRGTAEQGNGWNVSGALARDEGVGPIPRLGPWISTSRFRSPRSSSSGLSGGGSSGSELPSSGPGSSSPRARPSSSSSPPGSPPESERWRRPPKLARRGTASAGRVAGPAGGPSVFAPLAGLGEGLGASPPVPSVEIELLDSSVPVLKRPRSPGQGGVGSAALPAPLLAATSVSSRQDLVRRSRPCMNLGLGGEGDGEVSVLGCEGGGCRDLVPVAVSKDVEAGFLVEGSGRLGSPVVASLVAGVQGKGEDCMGKGKAVLVDVDVMDGGWGCGDGEAIFSARASALTGVGAGRSGRKGRGRRGGGRRGRGGSPRLVVGCGGSAGGDPVGDRSLSPVGPREGGVGGVVAPPVAGPVGAPRSRSPPASGRELGLLGHDEAVGVVREALASLREVDGAVGPPGESGGSSHCES